jgi:hypothetical protein
MEVNVRHLNTNVIIIKTKVVLQACVTLDDFGYPV